MATPRVFNFAAGPAVLPLPVLEEAQRDLRLPGWRPGLWSPVAVVAGSKPHPPPENARPGLARPG